MGITSATRGTKHLKSTTMECLRKMRQKSENRMSIIVEAGALAIVSNVEHLSLTSKYDISSIKPLHNGEGKEGFIEEKPHSLEKTMIPSSVNTNIQRKKEECDGKMAMALICGIFFFMVLLLNIFCLWHDYDIFKEENDRYFDENGRCIPE